MIKKNSIESLAIKILIGVFSFPFTSMNALASEHEFSYFSDTTGSTDIAALRAVLIDDLKQASYASGGFVNHRWGFTYNINDNWTFILAERAGGTVDTNSNTVESYYFISKKKNISQQPLDVFLKYELLHAKGFGLSYNQSINDVSFKFDLYHWNVQEFRDSFASGNVRGTNKGSIRGTVDFVEYYSDRNFLKRPKREGAWQNNGKGLSLDVYISYDITEDVNAYLEAKDILSSIKFNNLGHTFGKISSDNSFIDSNGNLAFLPVLSGKETKSDLNYKIPQFTKIGLTWDMNALWQIGTEINYNDILPLYQFGVTHPIGSHRVGFWLNPRYKMPSFHWAYDKWKINFGMDNLNTNKAKNFYLAVQAPFSF